MRIACIIHSLDGGGAERVMAGLASRLSIRGHAVTLITLDNAQHDQHTLSPAVDRRPLDVMSDAGGTIAKVRDNLRRRAAVRQAILDGQPDVVLSFCDRTNVLTLLATRRLKIPIVVSERSDPSQQNMGPLWERLRNRSYRRATVIVALTETSASHLKQHQVPVRVIPSAVETPPSQSNRAQAIENHRIVGVGRLEPEKGFDRLVQAFAAMIDLAPETTSGWTLRIIGQGSMKEQLESQIQELGLVNRVTLTGWISPIWDELGGATLFVLPSRYEGFPSALLEAMACGVPSIAVDCQSGPRELISDSSVGLLVANSHAALRDGMRKMIEDETMREQLGAAGRRASKQFAWPAMVDAYESLLRDAIAIAAAE